MNLENIFMLTISALLMVYLIYALLRPDKFCYDAQRLVEGLRTCTQRNRFFAG